jgi:hypothetical protein
MEDSNMNQLFSILHVLKQRGLLGLLVGFVLTTWPAFRLTAVAAQELKNNTLAPALTQATGSAQEAKSKDTGAPLAPTAFTYQGQLKDITGPVNGVYDFQFTLYSAQTGGEVLGLSETKEVVLTNGLFSLCLDFGRVGFEAKESWLEIGVRPSGSTDSYTSLSPRQKLTPTPYAIFARHDQWSLIGVPVGFVSSVDKATVITDEIDEQGLADTKKGSEAAAKNSSSVKAKGAHAERNAAAANGVEWTRDGAGNLFPTNLGDRVGIGTTTPRGPLHVHDAGGFTPIFLSTGSGSEGPATFRLQADSGLFGQGRSFVIYDEVAAQYRMVINGSGSVGIGTTIPRGSLHVHNSSSVTPIFLSTGSGSEGAATFRLQADSGLFGQGRSFVIYDDAAAQYRMVINGSGNIGIGTTTPTSKVEIAAQDGLAITGYQPFLTLRDANASGKRSFIQGVNGDLVFIPDSFANKGAAMVIRNGDGLVTVKNLFIQGGADLSENFDVGASATSGGETSAADVQPGMVVAIDAKNPGKLVVSDQAYDRRVAGIVSGAGGVKPGMMMGQSDSIADGGHPVALTGRVYCLVDASFGAIEPGDLLTSSPTAGHAMKVTDHTKAHGAILGKAMTGLTDGRGLVLVLVTLQ